jgi:hypothetical protein
LALCGSGNGELASGDFDGVRRVRGKIFAGLRLPLVLLRARLSRTDSGGCVGALHRRLSPSNMPLAMVDGFVHSVGEWLKGVNTE